LGLISKRRSFSEQVLIHEQFCSETLPSNKQLRLESFPFKTSFRITSGRRSRSKLLTSST
jgi:hypothetical protein